MSVYKQSTETKTAFLGGKIKGKFLQRTEKHKMHEVLHLGIRFYAVLFICFYLCTVELWVISLPF